MDEGQMDEGGGVLVRLIFLLILVPNSGLAFEKIPFYVIYN